MTSDALTPSPNAGAEASTPASEPGWTAAIRRRVAKTLPLTELLPTRQPAYIGSWVYAFGVITIAALFWVVLSGVLLAFFGSAWWHISPVGKFFNSTHFWSVQMFFIFMVLHLWGQYWGAGWRDGRAATWMVGVVIFLVSVVTAFTGYLIQQNFASQWIAVNAKDGINGTGAGGLFNVLNFGQQYGLHVMLFPIGVTLLVALHVIQVRSRGVVRPIGDPVTADDAGVGA
jgi:quinol-cytochrome oxidoreductase complex cytochrome b subunit